MNTILYKKIKRLRLKNNDIVDLGNSHVNDPLKAN